MTLGASGASSPALSYSHESTSKCTTLLAFTLCLTDSQSERCPRKISRRSAPSRWISSPLSTLHSRISPPYFVPSSTFETFSYFSLTATPGWSTCRTSRPCTPSSRNRLLSTPSAVPHHHCTVSASRSTWKSRITLILQSAASSVIP